MKKNRVLLLLLLLSISTYAQNPGISSISPATANAGSSVVINGTNFTGNEIVYFGTARATVTAHTGSTLTVTVPLAGSYDYVSVTNYTSNYSAFSRQPYLITFCGEDINSASFSNYVQTSNGGQVGANPSQIIAADLDYDGKNDFIACNKSFGDISVHRNNYSGILSNALSKTVFGSSLGALEAIATADFDEDGRKDIAV